MRNKTRRTQAVTVPTTVQMHPVDSTAISEWGYDQPSRQLVVKFHQGGEYAYVGVPAKVALDVITDEHPGSVFAKKVRGKYPVQKLG